MGERKEGRTPTSDEDAEPLEFKRIAARNAESCSRFIYLFIFGSFIYLFFLFLFFFKFYFIFKLYIIVLVLPNIKMNPPQVYMCSPS